MTSATCLTRIITAYRARFTSLPYEAVLRKGCCTFSDLIVWHLTYFSAWDRIQSVVNSVAVTAYDYVVRVVVTAVISFIFR